VISSNFERHGRDATPPAQVRLGSQIWLLESRPPTPRNGQQCEKACGWERVFLSPLDFQRSRAGPSSRLEPVGRDCRVAAANSEKNWMPLVSARRVSPRGGTSGSRHRLDGPRAEAPPRYKGALYLTTSLNPHELVKPSLALPLPGSQSLAPLYSTPSADVFQARWMQGKYISGGTPWVLSRGVYVAVVHVQPRRDAASESPERAEG